MTMPPSTLRTCPVMYAAAGSMARNLTSPATSSGEPYLSAGHFRCEHQAFRAVPIRFHTAAEVSTSILLKL